MNKKKIFITGGSGFVGRNFIEQRKDTYDILAPSHNELELLDTQAVDHYFNKNAVDVVLHCANIGGLRSDTNLKDVLKDNLKIFHNIVRNDKKFRKMINLGSGAVYDKSRNISRVVETDFGKRIPQDDYGLYKYICSTYIEKSPNIVDLRIFGLFGKYENYTVKFISNLVCKYIHHRKLSLLQNAYFDYVFIDDFIMILDRFITSAPHHRSYNIGSGKRASLLSIAKKINTLDTYSLPITVKKPGLNFEYTCDNSRLMQEMKSFQFSSLDSSFKKVFEHYLKNWSNIDRKSIINDIYNR